MRNFTGRRGEWQRGDRENGDMRRREQPENGVAEAASRMHKMPDPDFLVLIAPSRFRASAVFQKSREKPAWRIAGRVNEVNGVNEVSFGGCPSLSDGSTK
jgi:hypothetical protein